MQMSIQKKELRVVDTVFTYYTIGQGRPLFLVPAFHSDIQRFEALLRALGKYFTVYLVDLPGIGSAHPMGHHKHTMALYAKYLSLMVSELGLQSYVLSGVCLGGAIVVRMLEQGVPKPDHILLFESIYSASYIHLEQPYKFILNALLTHGIRRPTVKHIARFLLHDKKFLNYYFRLRYRHERNLAQVVENQIRLTDEMNSRAWLELVDDIFRLDFDQIREPFDIPTTLVYNQHDNILDEDGTIAGMQRLFPNSSVVRINLSTHAPPGPVSDAFIRDAIGPVIPTLRSLANKKT